MKCKLKRAAAGIVLLSFLLLLSSCGRSEREPRMILIDFCCIYGMETQVFYSGAAEGGDGYIDGETVEVIYCDPLPVGVEYAIALHSKLSSVREAGVFVAWSSSDKYELLRLIDDRLSYLTAIGAKGEPFIIRRGDIIAYGFVEDGSEGERIMRELVG